MAVDPDNLLIFKMRRQDAKKPISVAQAPIPQPIGAKQEVVTGASAQRQEATRSANAKPADTIQPQPQPVKQVSVPAPGREMQKQEKQAVQQQAPKVEEKERYIVAPTVGQEVVDATLTATLGTSDTQPQMPTPSTKKKLKPKEMREIASHMACENHPWRRAYALCDTCKRAFCYEDIVEQGGRYYCLDDIDSAPKSMAASQMVKYNNLGIVAAFLFVCVLVGFVYFSYQQIISDYHSIALLGLQRFVATASVPQALLAGGLIIGVLSFIAALAILLDTRGSFRYGIAIGILAIALFGYQYQDVLKLYYGIMAGIAFAAIIVLAYSRAYYEPARDNDANISMDALLDMGKSSF